MDRKSCFEHSREEETVRILGEEPPQKVDAHAAFPLAECLLCTCFCTFFASMLGMAMEENDRSTRRVHNAPCVKKCIKKCRRQPHVHQQQHKGLLSKVEFIVCR